MMKALVIAEHDSHALSPATKALVSAAKTITQDVTVWVLGTQLGTVCEEAAKLDGVKLVLKTESDKLQHFLAEPMAANIAAQAGKFTHVLAPASTFGKNILPRVAALLDCDMLSDVLTIVSPNCFLRPIYAGNAIETIESSARIQIMTVRASHFAEPGSQNPASIQEQPVLNFESKSQFVSLQANKSDRPELTSAKVVVSGGRGLQNAENFKLIYQLAEKLNAAVGASRAAVDANFVPNDFQVGQTGKIVAPNLYIAVGISGAIQHLAGMKESKCIVAINKDPDAPIFEIADYGLVGDLFEILPKMISSLG